MFSKTTEYAIRATIYIAQKGTIDNKLGIEKISKAVDSPKSFTSKILQLLAGENKIINSSPGPNGGFYITKKAMALPVRALLEIFGEDDIFNKCVMGLKNCSDKKPCPMHAQYKPIKEQLINIFEKKTIGELAADITNGTTFIKN
jgi:Rrf2 family iron-sulfur cluster assembly transcriptional regulator